MFVVKCQQAGVRGFVSNFETRVRSYCVECVVSFSCSDFRDHRGSALFKRAERLIHLKDSFCSPLCLFGSLHSRQRALPSETKVEKGSSQSKSETSVDLSNSG